MFASHTHWRPLVGACLCLLLVMSVLHHQPFADISSVGDVQPEDVQPGDIAPDDQMTAEERISPQEPVTALDEGKSKGNIIPGNHNHPGGPQVDLPTQATGELVEEIPEKYSHSLVVATTSNDDISWLAYELPDLEVYQYIADNELAEYHPPKNKGRESMIYLTHIIDQYENLTDVTTFVHAHRTSWHNNDIFNFDMAKMLKKLRLAHVVETAPGGFFNLRCHQESGCPAESIDNMGHFDYRNMRRNYLRETWAELHGKDTPIPDSLSAMCCAQFAISKAAIRKISKERWIEYRDWLLNTKLSDDLSGRVWEFTWHYIITGNPVNCPATNDCYCQGYGMCFEGGEAQIDSFLAMKEVLYLAEERMKDLTMAKGLKQSKKKEDLKWHIDQKLNRVMDKRKEMAEIRGKRIFGEKTEL